MFNIKITKTALNYIYEMNKNIKNELDIFVIAIFNYSTGSWTLSFCGNVIELVEKRSVSDNIIEFIKYDYTENPNIEIFIEKEILPDLMDSNLNIIDAAIGEVKGEKVCLLFFKKDSNVYG